MGYNPLLNSSIIDRSWRGGSISSTAESIAYAAWTISREGLKDEEHLEAMWTTIGDGPIWEGCGVDVRGMGTTVGYGVGTLAMYGVGTIIECGVGTLVRDGDWMGVL